MNVNIWGPPLWSILHGISFRIRPEQIPAAVEFLQSLRITLPCKFCRESYGPFLDAIVQEGLKERGLGAGVGNQNKGIEQLIVAGYLPRMIYNLHNKVNGKLNKQRYEDELVPMLGAALAPALHAPVEEVAKLLKGAAAAAAGANAPSVYEKLNKSITFEVLQKRQLAKLNDPISREDVWLVLTIFALHEEVNVKGYKAMVHALVSLLHALPSFKENIQHLRELCKKLADAKDAPQLRLLVAQQHEISTGCTRKDAKEKAQEALERMQVCKAGACIRGTCQ